MSDHDFQATVLRMLSEVQSTAAVSAAAITNIEAHLKALNGKVAAHEKQLNERTNWCPLVENLADHIEESDKKIRNIEDFLVYHKAELKTDTTWKDHMRPIGYTIISTFVLVIIVLVLAHSGLIIEFLKR